MCETGTERAAACLQGNKVALFVSHLTNTVLSHPKCFFAYWTATLLVLLGSVRTATLPPEKFRKFRKIGPDGSANTDESNVSRSMFPSEYTAFLTIFSSPLGWPTRAEQTLRPWVQLLPLAPHHRMFIVNVINFVYSDTKQ